MRESVNLRKAENARRRSVRIKEWRRVLLGVVGIIALCVGVLIWHTVQVNAFVARQATETHDFIEKSDAQIKTLTAQRIARQEAEAKKAAQNAADSAADGTSDPSSVNSSVCNRSSSHNDPTKIDVVVNKKHCMQPVNYAPPDLVESHGAELSAKAITAFNDMFNAAAAAGQGFYVTSSYRSYNDQVATYNYWVSTSGKSGADTYSARPGYSEHQTGLAMDVAANGCVLDCFGSTTQYQWLQAHAADYGFIQRYYVGYESITGYKAEEWHYRYVGTTVAKDMKAKGIKTLEQYWNIPGGDY